METNPFLRATVDRVEALLPGMIVLSPPEVGPALPERWLVQAIGEDVRPPERPLLVLRVPGQRPGPAGPPAQAGDFFASLWCAVYAALDETHKVACTSWAEMARRCALRIEQRAADAPAARGDAERREGFLAARRRSATGGPLPPSVLARMSHGSRFALVCRSGPAQILAALGLLDPVEWRGATVSRSLLPLDEMVQRATAEARGAASAEDEVPAFLQRLRAEGPIRGVGPCKAFSIALLGGRDVVIRRQVGGPFLHEGAPGRFLLYGQPLFVEVRGPADAPFGEPSNHSVFVAEDLERRRPGATTTNLELHPFVSSGHHTVCLGLSSGQYGKRAPGDTVSQLLHGRLTCAARVLRYGWKRTNRNRPFRTYGWVDVPTPSAAFPFVVLDREGARRFVAEHPDAEIAPWDR